MSSIESKFISSLPSSSSSFMIASGSSSDMYGSSVRRSSYDSYRDGAIAFFFGSTCSAGLMCSVEGNRPKRYLR